MMYAYYLGVGAACGLFAYLFLGSSQSLRERRRRYAGRMVLEVVAGALLWAPALAFFALLIVLMAAMSFVDMVRSR